MIFKKRPEQRESASQAIPSWVLEVDPERARYDAKLLMELFMVAFFGRSTPFGVMETVRAHTAGAVTGGAFPPVLREALQRADSPATLPNFFFLCYAEDAVDPDIVTALRGFEANFARVHRPRLKELARACIRAVPLFLDTWFVARGAADSDEPRTDFFEREYECGLRVLGCRTRDELPLHGREAVQILPKVSALVLVQNALAAEPGRGGPVPRVSTVLEVVSPERREPRIHKFVLHERIGDPSPQRLYLTDSEPEWWFTVGSREWDDVFIPNLPCRTELRVALRTTPGVPTEPAVAEVTARVQPSGSSAVELGTHLDHGIPRSRFLPYEMRATPDGSGIASGTPVTVRVVTMQRSFPVREILRVTRLYNPVLRLVGRLLPWPADGGRRFGRALPGRAGRGAGGLNRVSVDTHLGTVDLGALVLGLDGESPYLEIADPNTERTVQLVRGGSISAVQGRTALQSEDRVRVVSGDEQLDLVWRSAGDARFLEGIEDVYAGGLMLERGEKTAEQFIWVAAYEELGAGRTPEEAPTCYVVCRGGAGHVPPWLGADPARVPVACLVGDPYLSGDGSFGFMLSAQDGSFHTRMLPAPQKPEPEVPRTFFHASEGRWHPWTGVHSGSPQPGDSWDLSKVQEIWSNERKLQEFIVGSSLFDITLSGTL